MSFYTSYTAGTFQYFGTVQFLSVFAALLLIGNTFVHPRFLAQHRLLGTKIIDGVLCTLHIASVIVSPFMTMNASPLFVLSGLICALTWWIGTALLLPDFKVGSKLSEWLYVDEKDLEV